MGIYGNGTAYLTATGTLNIIGNSDSRINFGEYLTITGSGRGNRVGGSTLTNSGIHADNGN